MTMQRIEPFAISKTELVPVFSAPYSLMVRCVLFIEIRPFGRNAAQIKALRGKYRNLLTPSDEFARMKLDEIALER